MAVVVAGRATIAISANAANLMRALITGNLPWIMLILTSPSATCTILWGATAKITLGTGFVTMIHVQVCCDGLSTERPNVVPANARGFCTLLITCVLLSGCQTDNDTEYAIELPVDRFGISGDTSAVPHLVSLQRQLIGALVTPVNRRLVADLVTVDFIWFVQTETHGGEAMDRISDDLPRQANFFQVLADSSFLELGELPTNYNVDVLKEAWAMITSGPIHEGIYLRTVWRNTSGGWRASRMSAVSDTAVILGQDR